MIKFLINQEEYDFDGKVSAVLNGKNKSTLKMDGVFALNENSERNILSFPLYSRVQLFNDDQLLFQGVIKESTPTEIGNKYAIKPAKVQVYDYKDFLSSSVSLSKTFRQVKPVDVLNWVFDNLPKTNQVIFQLDIDISFGLEMIIENWTIQDGNPYDILNELATRTNSRFWVRNNVIYFRSWNKMVENADYHLTIQKFDDHISFQIPDLISIKYQDSSSFGYANSITVRSKNVISSQTFIQNFPIIQSQTSFTTDFGIGEIKEAWLFDSKTQTWRQLFTRESKWTDEPYNQWYEIQYTQGKNQVDYNNQLKSLTNGQTLYIEYYAMTVGASIQTNDSEIERVLNTSKYGDGRIVYIEQKDDITSQSDLDNYALSLLDKMSTPRHDYVIETASDTTWEVSDIVLIDNESYVVDSIEWDHLFIKNNFNVLHYTYTLTNTKNDNQAINFYDNRLITDSDTDNVNNEIVVNAQLTMTIGKWQETSTEYFKTKVANSGQHLITLLNKDKQIFYQESKEITLDKNYELEVELNGESMEWEIY